MPFPITRGYGSQGDGTSSGLASIGGLGDPGASGAGTFTLLLVEAYPEYLDLIFSVPLSVDYPALDPSQWSISTLDGTASIPVVSAVSTPTSTKIRLTISEPTEGVLYTIAIPTFGIKDLSLNPYTGPFTFDFIADAEDPIVSLAGAQDGYHVKVIFSEPVVASEALIAGNYVITGGAGLSVFEVTQETANTFILRTSLQVVGQTYTVTVSNIHDLHGNLI